MQIEDYEQLPLGFPQREVLEDAVYIEPSTSIKQMGAHMMEQQTCVAGVWHVLVQKMCP
jgi:hypothetical protein